MQPKGNECLLHQAKRTLRSLIRMQRSRSLGISQVNLNTLEKSISEFIEKVYNKLSQKIVQCDVYLSDIERLNELSKFGADDISRSLINEERSLLKRYFNLPNHYKISLIEKYYNNYLKLSQLALSSNHNDQLNQRENLQNCRSSLEGAHASLISLIKNKATQCEKKYLTDLSQRLNQLINKQFNEMVNKVRTCNRLQMPAEQFLNRYKKKKLETNLDNHKQNPYEHATLQNRHQELFYEENADSSKSSNHNKKILLDKTNNSEKSIKNTRYDRLAEDIMQGKNFPITDDNSTNNNDDNKLNQSLSSNVENKPSYEDKQYGSNSGEPSSENTTNQCNSEQNKNDSLDNGAKANSNKKEGEQSGFLNDNERNKNEGLSSDSNEKCEIAKQSTNDTDNNQEQKNSSNDAQDDNRGSAQNYPQSNENRSEQNSQQGDETSSNQNNNSFNIENSSPSASNDNNQNDDNKESNNEKMQAEDGSSNDSDECYANKANESVDKNNSGKENFSNKENSNERDDNSANNNTENSLGDNNLNFNDESNDNYLPTFDNKSEENENNKDEQKQTFEKKNDVPDGAKGTGQMFAMNESDDSSEDNDPSATDSVFPNELNTNNYKSLLDFSALTSADANSQELRTNDKIDKSFFSSYDSNIYGNANNSSNDSINSNQDSQMISSVNNDFLSLSQEGSLGVDDINLADSYIEELVDDLISNKSGLWSEPGSEEGKLTSRGINNFTKFFNLIDECSGIQKLLKIMGKSMGLDKQQKRRIREHLSAQDKILSENSREEFTGITMGNEISYVLPEEIVKISDPLTESLFDINYLEGNLLSFDLSGFINVSSGGNERIMTSPRHGRGPVVLCVDTSSSMRGIPESYAKAVAMSLALKCRSAKRDCYIINFSVSIEKMLLKSDSPNAVSRLNSFLGKSFDGGSDLDEALIECLALMRNDPRFFHSDVLCITDGQIKFSKKLEKLVNSRRNHERNHFYELVIGSLANEQYWIEAKQSLYDQSRIFDHLYELGQDGKWIREITL